MKENIMGHDKLRKFAENETFDCLLQPSSRELLADGYFSLRDHEIKGRWCESMFKRQMPIVLELGCGKGEYTIELAKRDASRNFIGVDIKGARLWKGAKYAHSHAMPNVAFLRTRIELISAFFAENEVESIWLTFSDPQIRRENARLSSPIFLDRYRRFLVKGGEVHLKTDSRFLYEYTLAVCKANNLKINACTTDLYACENRGDIPQIAFDVQTFYESLFLEQGYKINYISFCIDHEGEYVSPSDFDAEYWRENEGDRQIFGHDTAETRRQKLKKEKRSDSLEMDR